MNSILNLDQIIYVDEKSVFEKLYSSILISDSS